REMVVRAGRGGDARGDVERENPLAEVVGLARMTAHEVAQRPLQEQEKHDRQDQPLQAAQERGDAAVEKVEQVAHARACSTSPAARPGLASVLRFRSLNRSVRQSRANFGIGTLDRGRTMLSSGYQRARNAIWED